MVPAKRNYKFWNKTFATDVGRFISILTESLTVQKDPTTISPSLIFHSPQLFYSLCLPVVLKIDTHSFSKSKNLTAMIRFWF